MPLEQFRVEAQHVALESRGRRHAALRARGVARRVGAAAACGADAAPRGAARQSSVRSPPRVANGDAVGLHGDRASRRGAISCAGATSARPARQAEQRIALAVASRRARRAAACRRASVASPDGAGAAGARAGAANRPDASDRRRGIVRVAAGTMCTRRGSEPAPAPPGAARTAQQRASPPAVASTAPSAAARSASSTRAALASRRRVIVRDARRYNRAVFRARTLRVNPRLALLQPYPFERLRALFAGVTPDPAKRAISLSHRRAEASDAAPRARCAGRRRRGPRELSHDDRARPRCARRSPRWLARRHASAGARSGDAGAAGARQPRGAVRVRADGRSTRAAPARRWSCPIRSTRSTKARRCSPAPSRLASTPIAARRLRARLGAACRPRSGRARSCSTSARRTIRPAACSTCDEWRELFALSDRYGFVIASDECYSEIYFDEARPPLGALAAAHALGRDGYPRLVVFGSLSKRSNAPGLRSGYVAGDAALMKAFLLYRTYHGAAMSPARSRRRASPPGTTRRT